MPPMGRAAVTAAAAVSTLAAGVSDSRDAAKAAGYEVWQRVAALAADLGSGANEACGMAARRVASGAVHVTGLGAQGGD